MKHLLFCLAIICCSQTSEAQTKIAVKGAWNYSTARIYYKDTKQPAEYKSGLGFGVQFKIPFEEPLYFTPSISYNMRGYKYAPTVGDTSFFDNTLHYIDITPALSYDFSIGSNKLFISAGPQFSVAVSGNEQVTIRSTGETISGPMKFSNSGYYGRADVGLNLGVGYNFKKIIIEAGYLLGLTNINNNVDLASPPNSQNYIDPRNIRHRVFSLRLGYYLK